MGIKDTSVLLRGAGLVALACSWATIAAAQPVEVSLKEHAAGLKIELSEDPGSYVVKFASLLPAHDYIVSVQHHAIPIAPVPTLRIPGLQPSPPREAARAETCPAVRAASKALADAKEEAQVPTLASALRGALSGGCDDPAVIAVANAFLDRTTTTQVVEVISGQETIVEIQRGPIDDQHSAAKWTLVLKGPSRGGWDITYGVAVARDRNQRFFAKAADGGKFTVTRERGNKGGVVIPAMYFSWTSTAAERHNWSFSPSVGFGVTNEAPAVLVGLSVTYNRNVMFTFGGGLLRETRLNGQYHEGDSITENLSSDQLHEKVWNGAWTIGVAIRFASNPFSSGDDKKKPEDKKAGDTKPADTKPVEKETPASTRDHEALSSSLSFSDSGYRLSFTEGGDAKAESAQTRARLLDAMAGATDVFIMSHGWWNRPAAADCRYQQLVDGLRDRMPVGLVTPAFKPLFVGIYWPSVIFPTETGDCEPAIKTPHGAETNVQGSFDEDLKTWAAAAFPAATAMRAFPGERDRFAALLGKERRGEPLTRADALALTTLLDNWRRAEPSTAAAVSDAPAAELFGEKPSVVVDEWIGSGAAGAPESSTLQRALNLTNLFTFWTMKERAGVVGSRGVYALIHDIRSRGGARLRIHLIGHSFGGRLLAAAIAGPPGAVMNQVDSLIMLEGAFSHFAFSSQDQIAGLGFKGDKGGLFESVVKSLESPQPAVRGRMVAMFSRQDHPNQVLYPLASRIKGSDREAARPIRFGSIGADGFQGPQARSIRLSGATFAQLDAAMSDPSGKIFNVDGSDVVLGHSDLIHDAVFDLIWASALVSIRPR